MKIKIHVTKEVLEKTKMCGTSEFESSFKTCYEASPAFNCAIAFAVRKLFPKASIHRNDMLFDLDDKSIEADLPDTAVKFIKEFDALKGTPEKRLALPEFSFDIDVPSEVINKIGIGDVYKILSESKTLELVQP